MCSPRAHASAGCDSSSRGIAVPELRVTHTEKEKVHIQLVRFDGIISNAKTTTHTFKMAFVSDEGTIPRGIWIIKYSPDRSSIKLSPAYAKAHAPQTPTKTRSEATEAVDWPHAQLFPRVLGPLWLRMHSIDPLSQVQLLDVDIG